MIGVRKKEWREKIKREIEGGMEGKGKLQPNFNSRFRGIKALE